MKVVETIERRCCHSNDLKPYLGNTKLGLKFCIHCGQLWSLESETGPAGDVEWGWEKVNMVKHCRTNEESARKTLIDNGWRV